MSEFNAAFANYDAMRQIDFSNHVVNNQDINFVRDMLARQTPEFRAFIVGLAYMICKADDNEVCGFCGENHAAINCPKE